MKTAFTPIETYTGTVIAIDENRVVPKPNGVFPQAKRTQATTLRVTRCPFTCFLLGGYTQMSSVRSWNIGHM
ncbi:hypothetical protein Y1Q_0021291 [Alligator mississippiensis]|uniref:Uncharacterized protein n=1 Tax=Alligator mississippiensis TaxID=8496 RepID=A0A151P988_ALLMI|nr:hypothetical protein Y1Q_0021291 [Alligator mississippiensis]